MVNFRASSTRSPSCGGTDRDQRWRYQRGDIGSGERAGRLLRLPRQDHIAVAGQGGGNDGRPAVLFRPGLHPHLFDEAKGGWFYMGDMILDAIEKGVSDFALPGNE